MTAPKVDTIRRHCDNGLAISILAERCIISAHEAEQLHQRCRVARDAAYDRIYGREPDPFDSPTTNYRTRDLGYGVEEGVVFLPALGEADWTGKRPYRAWFGGPVVYLFDDEVDQECWV